MPRLSHQRRVPGSPEMVFDLVADVERYPEFLPGWRMARVVERQGNVLTVEQSLGSRGFDWRFRTTATLDRPLSIHIAGREYPFRYLDQVWRFEPAGRQATDLSLEARYALNGRILQRLVSRFIDEGFRQTLRAFEQRARQLPG